MRAVSVSGVAIALLALAAGVGPSLAQDRAIIKRLESASPGSILLFGIGAKSSLGVVCGKQHRNVVITKVGDTSCKIRGTPERLVSNYGVQRVVDKGDPAYSKFQDGVMIDLATH